MSGQHYTYVSPLSHIPPSVLAAHLLMKGSDMGSISTSSTHSLPAEMAMAAAAASDVGNSAIPTGVVVSRGVPLNNSIMPTAPVEDEEDLEAKLILGKSFVVEKGMSVAQAAMEAGVSYYKLAKVLKNDGGYIQKQVQAKKKRAMNREIDDGIMEEIRKECKDPNIKISPTTLRKYRKIALDGIRAKQQQHQPQQPAPECSVKSDDPNQS